MAGRWEYPPLAVVMAAVGIEEVETYALLHHNSIAQYIKTCPILDLFLTLGRRMRARVSWWWWEQDRIDLGLGEGRTAERVMEVGREAIAEMEVAERRGEAK